MAIETIDFTDAAAEIFLEWEAMSDDARGELERWNTSDDEQIPLTVHDDFSVSLGNDGSGIAGGATPTLSGILSAILEMAELVDWDEERAEAFHRPVIAGSEAGLSSVYERLKAERLG